MSVFADFSLEPRAFPGTYSHGMKLVDWFAAHAPMDEVTELARDLYDDGGDIHRTAAEKTIAYIHALAKARYHWAEAMMAVKKERAMRSPTLADARYHRAGLRR